MRGLRLASALLLLSVGCASHQFPSGSGAVTEGAFKVSGVDGRGAAYSGVVEIRIQGPTVQAHWITGDGDSYGTGYLDGATLIIGFVIGGGGIGVATMRPTPSGYAGIWITGGMPAPASETWTRLPHGMTLPRPPVKRAAPEAREQA